MCGGDNRRIAKTQPVEFGRRRGEFHAFGFVDDQTDIRTPASEKIRDFLIAGRDAVACIHHEENDVAFVEGQHGLVFHQACQALLLSCKTTRINRYVGNRPHTAKTIATIASQTRKIRDDRVTTPGQQIEQCGLADIGASDKCDDGQHGRIPTALSRRVLSDDKRRDVHCQSEQRRYHRRRWARQ